MPANLMPAEKKPVTTSSGIPVETVYTSASLPSATDPDTDIGFPGEFPFTRGIYPTMYRGRLWTMRQYAGFGSAAESNQPLPLSSSKRTETGLSVAFDLPTQIGMDSDHPLALGEVGKVGVAIDSLEDMQTLFDGIPLDKRLHLDDHQLHRRDPARALRRRRQAARRRHLQTSRHHPERHPQGIHRARHLHLSRPPRHAHRHRHFRLVPQRNVPNWNTISISGYHIREAGSTDVQEVAFTLADGIAYVEAALGAGLDRRRIRAAALASSSTPTTNFLEEVAKFRAARRLWARIMRDRFGANDPRSQMLRFHAQTAGSSLTAQQPENNIVRVALQSLAAVLGGCQSLHANGFDEALALPTEDAALHRPPHPADHRPRNRRRSTPSIPSPAPTPSKSSPTKSKHRAQEYIARIDAMGGMLNAIEAGFVQQEIQNAAYDYQHAVECGEQVVVGVNQFRAEDEPPIPTHAHGPESLERRQIARLNALRLRRDSARKSASLAALRNRAPRPLPKTSCPLFSTPSNPSPPSAKSPVPSAEVFGEYREAVVV